MKRPAIHFSAADPIPTFAGLVHYLASHFVEEESTTRKIVAAVYRDPAVCARLLRLANSPYYGYQGRVGDPARAAEVIGPAALQAMTMGAPVFAVWERERAPQAVAEVWAHSYLTAPLHRLVEPALLALPQQREAGRAAGHEALERLLRHLGEARARPLRAPHRQLAAVPELAEVALGHPVEEVAALERVDPPALLGLGRRLEAQDVLQEVEEAAARVGGEAARRDGVAARRAGRAARGGPRRPRPPRGRRSG